MLLDGKQRSNIYTEEPKVIFPNKTTLSKIILITFNSMLFRVSLVNIDLPLKFQQYFSFDLIIERMNTQIINKRNG